MTNTTDEDDNYIYIIYAENLGGFSQPYSSFEKAKQASKKIQSLKPDWNVLIHKRQVDDTNFWENGYDGGEYAFKLRRITRCFDKQFILTIYFSLLAFLWFKI
jgi:hypothetical protein